MDEEIDIDEEINDVCEVCDNDPCTCQEDEVFVGTDDIGISDDDFIIPEGE